VIRDDFNSADLARAYERAGAACLSVLTDTPSFQGSPADLIAARDATRLPVLRKDFMLDPYQIVQSRAYGADCILIIAAMVNAKVASELVAVARDLGMEALVEVHNEAELDIALSLNPDMIGINNRDLKTFVTSLNTTMKLAPLIPPGRHVIAESGLSSAAELKHLAKAGVTAYLIGESFMRAPDVERAARDLIVGASL
jgi:indole-3-glycerol phosphate synthase